VFAIASRFATEQRPSQIKTPTEYASQVQRTERQNESLIDEVKTEFLLCVYNLAESLSRHSLSDLGRVIRLATLCGGQFLADPERAQPGSSADMKLEEWKSLWWSIYTLDVCCNTLT
jgi:hypothetical protein